MAILDLIGEFIGLNWVQWPLDGCLFGRIFVLAALLGGCLIGVLTGGPLEIVSAIQEWSAGLLRIGVSRLLESLSELFLR